MKIFLENLYHSDCYFLPIRDNQQLLVGVELITHFSSEDGTVRIPTSRVIAQLTEEQHWQLFSEQLELLKSCQHFFIQHKLFAWLNLTPLMMVSYCISRRSCWISASRIPSVISLTIVLSLT